MAKEQQSFSSANVPKHEDKAPDKDQQYAEALASQALLDYKMSQAKQPKTEHLISKKWIIYLAISLLLTIVSFAFMSGGSDDKKAQDSAKTQQLINSAQELHDANEAN